MRLFRRQGFAATGLQQIVAESGAPKGSLYHYFPTGKEGLGREAVELAGQLILEMLRDLAGRHRSAKGFLRAYCAQMSDWMEEAEFYSGCPIATTLLEMAPQSKEITEAGERATQAWIEVVAEVLQRDGTSRKQAMSRAELIIAAMEGALILARIRQSTQPIRNVATLL